MKYKSPSQPSIFSKLLEYIMMVMSASVIMYYLIKSLFGSPVQMKNNNENIIYIKNYTDTIYAFQNLIYDKLNHISNEQVEMKSSIQQNNNILQENIKEINALKKVVNQKINNANDYINNQQKTIIELQQKNYSSIDSFFKARQKTPLNK